MALGVPLYGVVSLGLMVVRTEDSEVQRITLGFMTKA